METIQGIPIVAFPCPPVWLVLKYGQMQQSQYRLIDLFFIYLRELPQCRKDVRNVENHIIRGVSDSIPKLTPKAAHMV